MSTTKRKRTTKKSSTKKETVADTVEAAAEAVEVAAEAAETVTPPDQVELEDLKIGYVVGLTQEDRFIFQLFGKTKGLVEMLGIHQHATRRVNNIYDEQQMSGDRLMHEVGRAVAQIAQKLDGLIGNAETVAPEATKETSATAE